MYDPDERARVLHQHHVSREQRQAFERSLRQECAIEGIFVDCRQVCDCRDMIGMQRHGDGLKKGQRFAPPTLNIAYRQFPFWISA